MYRKAIGTFLAFATIGLHSSRRYTASALKSPLLTRTKSSALLLMMISGRQNYSSQKISVIKRASENDYTSDVKEWRVEDVTFINSSVAKSIDDDLMFNSGSKLFMCAAITFHHLVVTPIRH